MAKKTPSKLPVNYSVQNIIESILADNRRSTMYTAIQKKQRHRECLKIVSARAGLSKILSISHIRRYPFRGADFFARLGVLAPEHVIVDQRFRQMCTLPYWTIYTDDRGSSYRSFGKCPGYGRLPGCPPHAPSVEETLQILARSNAFIVLQTRLHSERWETQWKFLVLHRLAHEIRSALGHQAVTGMFGSGPCAACPEQHCLHNRPCSSPELKTASLESMGICVDKLCTDLSELYGNSAWKLTWLKHFGHPQQTPQQWKYVVAVSVKIPG